MASVVPGGIRPARKGVRHAPIIGCRPQALDHGDRAGAHAVRGARRGRRALPARAGPGRCRARRNGAAHPGGPALGWPDGDQCGPHPGGGSRRRSPAGGAIQGADRGHFRAHFGNPEDPRRHGPVRAGQGPHGEDRRRAPGHAGSARRGQPAVGRRQAGRGAGPGAAALSTGGGGLPAAPAGFRAVADRGRRCAARPHGRIAAAHPAGCGRCAGAAAGRYRGRRRGADPRHPETAGGSQCGSGAHRRRGSRLARAAGRRRRVRRTAAIARCHGRCALRRGAAGAPEYGQHRHRQRRNRHGQP